MKMVAAAKLKRAQDNAEKSRPYAKKMGEIVNSLVESKGEKEFKYGERNNSGKQIIFAFFFDASFIFLMEFSIFVIGLFETLT